MELTTWLGLLASALFISISPGPGAIFSISQGTQYGFKRSLFSLIGLQIGLMSQIVFLLFGLGVLIDKFPAVFIIKLLGMFYLILLGVMQWRKKIEQISTSNEDPRVLFSPFKAVMRGFFVNLTNIKGTVFFLALIPLFIDLTPPLKLSTCIIFISTLIAIDLIVMTGYVALAEISKTLLSDPKKILWQNRLTGSTLIFVGLIMGTT